MTRPKHISGRRPLFTAEQVAAWREEYDRRQQVLRETRTIQQLAAHAGVRLSTMKQILRRNTYQWVR